MIPWIYLCFNHDFDNSSKQVDDKNNSLNSSRQPAALTGLSTNINKSGVLINNNNTQNQFDSQLNGSNQPI
jgi:hypothetical protein